LQILERIERIYAIGGGPGANRVGDSKGEQDAHELVTGWLEEAGLSVADCLRGSPIPGRRRRRPANDPLDGA
jgi:hypothetical protein